MAIHDTIGDFLTILRNAATAKKSFCTAQWSRMRESLLQILKDEGFIQGYEKISLSPGRDTLKISLKYVEGTSAITGLQRHSRPGCRMYYSKEKLPRVLGGLGIAIVSTSKGIMKDSQARRQKLGGELLAKIW